MAENEEQLVPFNDDADISITAGNGATFDKAPPEIHLTLESENPLDGVAALLSAMADTIRKVGGDPSAYVFAGVAVSHTAIELTFVDPEQS